MTHRDVLRRSLNHEEGPVPLDFGSSFITGIHCSLVESLRAWYGLPARPVKVCEPYQMLGLVEDDLKDAMGISTTSVFPYRTMFGFVNEDWREWRTPWGQEVLVSAHFKTVTDASGNVRIFPHGDDQAPPSGMLPASGYFFDTIERVDADYDPDNPRAEDNLEEFAFMGEEEARYWSGQAAAMEGTERAVVTHLNGTSLGDIALVPAPFMKNPKGVRGVADWYMLLAEDEPLVRKVFARQTEIALANLKTLHGLVGERLDVVVICGTDFGTQTSQFCSVGKLRSLWMPFYSQINEWIHTHTTWKTFKHSCGAIEPFISTFIECGFDILNPVQCSAAGMDPKHLKDAYGDRLTFWGAAVNTQQTLAFGTPRDVAEEVTERCRLFSRGGGFVCNAIHNVQALTPVANVVAMVEAVHRFNT